MYVHSQSNITIQPAFNSEELTVYLFNADSSYVRYFMYDEISTSGIWTGVYLQAWAIDCWVEIDNWLTHPMRLCGATMIEMLQKVQVRINVVREIVLSCIFWHDMCSDHIVW